MGNHTINGHYVIHRKGLHENSIAVTSEKITVKCYLTTFICFVMLKTCIEYSNIGIFSVCWGMARIILSILSTFSIELLRLEEFCAHDERI